MRARIYHPSSKYLACSQRLQPAASWCPEPSDLGTVLHTFIKATEMVARMLFFFAIMGSGRAVVSTIGQVRQVSFEAYDQNTGAALDADSRDVTVTNDGDCCMPEAGLEPLSRTGLLFSRAFLCQLITRSILCLEQLSTHLRTTTGTQTFQS